MNDRLAELMSGLPVDTTDTMADESTPMQKAKKKQQKNSRNSAMDLFFQDVEAVKVRLK
jgi:hypothetical protein